MRDALDFYRTVMRSSTPLLERLLDKRLSQSKEDPARLSERKGEPSIAPRPSGNLIWLHAASVGEAQSALILIETLLHQNQTLHVLVTTGTVTSAKLMAQRLPNRAFHQYIPIDHPTWMGRFIDHWQPDLVLWMESELWANALSLLGQHGIPAILINARLSPRSFNRWRWIKKTAGQILSNFSLILTQTKQDEESYKTLGATNVKTMGNLKYAAVPLPVDPDSLATLQTATQNRPVWLYASTHEGEEELACRIHQRLKRDIPDLLTVIVPRHPDRRDRIRAICDKYNLRSVLRTTDRIFPQPDDAIYIADTLGELGLFYRLCPIACIGRSFSADGGGGHNPIEAAQLGCAVLHGAFIQNLMDIYKDMDEAGAAQLVLNEDDFRETLKILLMDDKKRQALQDAGARFMADRGQVLDRVMAEIQPYLERIGMAESAQ